MLFCIALQIADSKCPRTTVQSHPGQRAVPCSSANPARATSQAFACLLGIQEPPFLSCHGNDDARQRLLNHGRERLRELLRGAQRHGTTLRNRRVTDGSAVTGLVRSGLLWGSTRSGLGRVSERCFPSLRLMQTKRVLTLGAARKALPVSGPIIPRSPRRCLRRSLRRRAFQVTKVSLL
jgi:hypothetical protein